jgi:hypothetical protein
MRAARMGMGVVRVFPSISTPSVSRRVRPRPRSPDLPRGTLRGSMAGSALRVYEPLQAAGRAGCEWLARTTSPGRHRRQLAQTHSREPSCMRLAPCGCRRHDNTKHVPRLQRGCAISSPTTTASVFRRVYLLGSCHFHPYKDTLVCHLTWSACVASQIDLQALALAAKLGVACAG